ncbi:MAG: SRPBCC family protein [Nocardioidaceae bacterium]
MELSHSFTVPASMSDTWQAFQDIESVAGCFPGATVTSVEGDDFKGSCKVKLGPISLVYSGAGSFVEKDEGAGRFVVEAKGKDKRGNGTAGATVTATFAAAGDASTKVDVVTDLAITGKPAQFGRGVIQDVSDKLLQQFVSCLESRVGAGAPAATDGGPPAAEPAAAAEAPTAATDGGQRAAARPAADEVGAGATAAALASSGDEAGGDGAAATAPAAPAPSSGYAGAGESSVGDTASWGPAPSGQAGEDALDLGATVLPILVRTYWKQVVGVLVALLVLRRLLRRRGGSGPSD